MCSEAFALGIDIGGTHLRMGLVAKDGMVLHPETKSTEVLFGNDPTSLLGNLISDYLYQHNTAVISVCIGFPATVDKSRTTVLSAPNVKGFDGVPVGKLLSEQLGLPVWIERDVNLLLLDDLKQLNIESDTVVACYVGTGVGNAILIDGHLLTGHNGVAGELGHIPFGDAIELCGCGNEGCAEPMVGGLRLARLCKEVFCDTPISELFTKHKEHPLLTQYVERLGRVIATEINLIDPELLILGGGVIEMQDFPRDTLEQSIRSHSRKPFPERNLKIRYSAAENGVAGAGMFAWRKEQL